MCRVFWSSSVTYTVSPLDRNWCSRNANSGRPLSGSLARAPACRVRWIAFSHWSWSAPVWAARSRAARWTVVGRAAGELSLVVAVEAERGLDPAGEGVTDQVAVVGGRGGGGDPRGP